MDDSTIRSILLFVGFWLVGILAVIIGTLVQRIFKSDDPSAELRHISAVFLRGIWATVKVILFILALMIPGFLYRNGVIDFLTGFAVTLVIWTSARYLEKESIRQQDATTKKRTRT